MKFTLLKGPEAPVAGYKPLMDGYGFATGGFLVIGGRSIPRVPTRLGARDRIGAFRMRLGFGRDRYRIVPGIYALGDPGRDSPVLVTANYKLSFDSLRKELEGINCFILAIDTKGVNVWCAAGKGSFGTAELASKLTRCRVAGLVDHRELVLPQLGAPGVSGLEVRKLSGFRVIWGPVRARDIKAWLAAGRVKDDSMSRVRFGLLDRLALAPIELLHNWPAIAGAIGLGVAAGIPFAPGWIHRSLAVALVLGGSVLAGTLAFPALLFALPAKSFAIKGAILGLVWGLAASALIGIAPALIGIAPALIGIAPALIGIAPAAFGIAPAGVDLTPALAAGLSLMSTAVVGWIGLNFTGSTTFTSPTGALAEVERTIWPAIAVLAAGALLSVAALIFGF